MQRTAAYLGLVGCDLNHAKADESLPVRGASQESADFDHLRHVSSRIQPDPDMQQFAAFLPQKECKVKPFFPRCLLRQVRKVPCGLDSKVKSRRGLVCGVLRDLS